ncbi:auxin-induced protein 22D [Canna indica]|uniref:Auxin-responsive protein n=1 Tax=Canna indica TaxID=4628 RepID=A0AAQ3QEH0_9LILI|nr:auxin-induced protein 22D [Canna indica]
MGSFVNDADNLRDTELRLGLPGTDDAAPEKSSSSPSTARGTSKRALEDDDDKKELSSPPAKAQVVGWPPVRSHRRNNLQVKKAEVEVEAEAGGLYVKVSMDGAPYLRKIDLKVYKGYKELRQALDSMFKCFSSSGEVSRKEGCEYAMTYEDKDGDWMMVGDVPWEMFISSCRRLRIMKGNEAIGLQSRA